MLKAFERVRNHLSPMGIKLRCKLNPKATTRDVDNAHSRLGLALPQSYVEFVTQVANGFELSWRLKEGPFASFEMASLDASTDGMLGMREWRFYDDAAAAAYGFPYVDDSALAMKTNKLMHNWLPIHAEGNGDNFSINLNAGACGKLIFDQHDWLDGGTGNNGFVMSSDLPSFLESWANVCFSQPKGLWWKSVIGSDGVTWNSNEFDNRFRINP